MSKTPKPFIEAKVIKNAPPKPIDLTHCEATYQRARDEVTRPVLAGIQISCNNKDGTLGLAYLSQTGGKRLITAGHVCNDQGDAIGQPDNNNYIATVMDFAPAYDGAEVDVVKANVDPTIDIDDNGVFGDLIDYWIDIRKDWTAKGDDIQIEGAASGMSAGKVHIPYAHIRVAGGGRVDAAAVATYDSAGMDSGAPVLGIDGNVTFYGIHGGRVIIESVSYAWFVPLGAFSDWL